MTYLYYTSVMSHVHTRTFDTNVILLAFMDDRGSIPGRDGDFFFRHGIQTNSRAQPDSYLMCTGVLSTAVKQSGREANHSHPVAGLRKHGTLPPIPQYVFMA